MIKDGPVIAGVQHYKVELYDPMGVKETITVPRPTDAEFALYASTTDGSVWLSVLEKAYISRWPRTEMYRSPRLDNYALYDVAARGEVSDVSVRRLTGSTAKAQTPANIQMARLVEMLDQVNKNKVIVVGTKIVLPADAVTAGVPEQHAFVVIGFNKAMNKIIIRNPWNADGPYGREADINIAQLRSWFNSISVEGSR